MAGHLTSALLVVGLWLLQGSGALRPWTPKKVDARALRGEFAEHCRPFPGKRVVLTTVGAEYVEMFANWLSSARPFLKETEQLHVIAEDWGAVQPLEKLRQEGAQFDISLGFNHEEPKPSQQESGPHGPHGHDNVKFGDKSYGGVVWRRPKHILRFLEQGCSVLYADIDTVWKKDVFLDIAEAGSGDLYLTDDSNVTNWNYCTCFMYVHPTVATRTLLVSWSEHRQSNFNQEEFNHQLFQALNMTDHRKPHLRALPFESFPPGHWADEVASPSVLHANWLKGIPAKVSWFQHHNSWNPLMLPAQE